MVDDDQLNSKHFRGRSCDLSIVTGFGGRSDHWYTPPSLIALDYW